MRNNLFNLFFHNNEFVVIEFSNHLIDDTHK